MNQGYPAILTPQLMECNERDAFQVTVEEESWIGNFFYPLQGWPDFFILLTGQIYDINCNVNPSKILFAPIEMKAMSI